MTRMLRNFIVLIALSTFYMAAVEAKPIFCTVTNIESSNHIRCQNTIQGTFVVEIYGMYAPPLGQPYHDEAIAMLSESLLNKKVKVQVQGALGKNHIVGRVFYTGINPCILSVQDENDEENTCLFHDEVATQMVMNGLAWCFPVVQYTSGKCSESEQNAKENQRGLWEDANPVPPW